MSLNCKYSYKGKLYTRYQIIKLIKDEKLYPITNVDSAKNWLKDTLGMSDHQIEVVKGLIDGKSFGRVLTDGNILLSDEMIEGTEYHEAFHRVFNFFLTDTERQDILNEVGSVNLDNKKKLYPDLSQDQLLEEYLADEFMSYVLNERQFKSKGKVQQFFDWLYNFFKNIFTKTDLKQELFKQINRGNFKSKPQKAYQTKRVMDMLKVSDVTVSPEKKHELFGSLQVKLLNKVLSKRLIYEFIDGSIDITKMLEQSIQESISELPNSQDDLYNAIFDDVYINDKLSPESNFVKEFFNYLTSLGVNTRIETKSSLDSDEESDVAIEEAENSEETIAKDFSFMKVSFEFDPKTNMSKAIKLILASLTDVTKSKVLGITKPVKVSDVSTLLFNNLANLPHDFDVLLDRLKFVAVKHPYLNQLIDYLTDASLDYNYHKFRNEFVQTFSKNLYDFNIGLIKKGDIYSIPAIDNNTTKKVLTELNNYLNLTYRDTSELAQALNTKRFIDIAKALGFDITESDGETISNEVLTIKRVVLDSIKAGTELQKLYSNKIEDQYNIRPALKKVAKFIAENKRPADLNFMTAEGKKMFAISLNNYQTIVVNHLNWIGSKDISLDEKLELVKKYVPNVLSKDNYRDGEIRSIWLKRILNGQQLKIGVYDGVNGKKKKSFSDLKETDLYAFNILLPFEGINQSIKHSSRSSIFTYKFQDNYAYVKNPDYDTQLDQAISFLKGYLQDELYAIQQFKSNDVGKEWTNYSENGGKLRDFSYLKNHPLFPQALETQNADLLLPAIKEYLVYKIDQFGKKAEEYGVFKDKNKKPVGIPNEMWEYFKNKNSKENTVKSIVAFAYLNGLITHIEEQKLLTGSSAFYKNLEDMYKRLGMQSSTGELLIADQYNNDYIAQVNSRDSQVLYNPVTGNMEDFVYDKPMGMFTEFVTEEYSGYVSDLTVESDLLSPITNEKVSVFRFVYETNLIKQLKPYLLEKGYTETQANNLISKQIELYESKYREINENDGQSHMTIFGYREYEHRASKWTKQKENNFQLQLKALTLKSESDLKNLEVYVKYIKDKNGNILESIVKAYPSDTDNYEKIKVFDNYDAKWFKKTFEAFTPLKGQYVGGVFYGEQELNVVGLRKTSYMPLQPTIIIGTNLQKLNTVMIKKGVDLHHFKSAAKGGTLANVKIQFYTPEGEFNYDELNNLDNVTMLDVRYMKDQLKISSKNKNEIKNSTQSAKIILSNIMSDGYPKDVLPELREMFNNASEQVKGEMSELYKLSQDYKETLNKLIKNNINKLKNELNAVAGKLDTYTITKFNKFINTLTQAAIDRNSPLAVLDAIEQFADSKIIETLPNKSKIENLLFSIVTNKVINFKRPGDAKAQLAVTGFESGARTLINGKLSNSGVLKFYSPVIENGKIIKVNPAEIAMAVPEKWIKLLLERYNTTNIQDAIDQYNNDSKKFRVKGLRIPNQQLSSNDVFEIKKFYLPLTESFVIVPTEIVVKSGSDFDIDKLQLYYPEDSEYDKLLNIELDILLHPDNFHNLLKPLIDDELKVNVQNTITNLFKQRTNEKERELDKKLQPSDITDNQTNIDKFIQFIETKAGVGVFALGITGHSVSQIDNIQISDQIYIGKDKQGNPIYLSTQVPFEGEYSSNLGRFYDEKGFDIIESLSVALTSQVDGEKNPYARLLGLTSQTLGIVNYLLRRGVTFENIVLFLKQPVIESYLLEQRINESQIYQSNKLDVNKKELLEKVISKNNLSKADYDSSLEQLNAGNLVLDNKTLSENIRTNKVEPESLAAFVYLTEVTKYFRKFVQDLTPDTKAMKDIVSVESMINNYDQLISSNIIQNTDTYRNGLLKSFFEARDLYRKLYINLYFTRNFNYTLDLKMMQEKFSKIQSDADSKIKVANQIENQLMAYVVQNYHPIFKSRPFEELMSGENSLPKRISKIINNPTDPLNSNYAIQNMYVELNNVKDELTQSSIDNLRIYERNLSTIALNDIYETFQELRLDLQEDFIALSIYQSGLNTTPYNLSNILPADKMFEIFKQALPYADSMNFSDFAYKFEKANLEHLPTNNFQATANGFIHYTDRDFDTNETVLRLAFKPKFYGDKNKGQQVAIEGSSYHKVYNRTELSIPDIEVDLAEVIEPGNDFKPNEIYTYKDLAKDNKGKTVSVQYEKYNKPFSGIITGNTIIASEGKDEKGYFQYVDIEIQTTTGKLVGANPYNDISGIANVDKLTSEANKIYINKASTVVNTEKLFDKTDKVLKKGSVVNYNNKKYLFWNENSTGKAQLINEDGTKFSGTPNIDKLEILGSFPTVSYNNTDYIVTDKNNVYSGATGNLVYTGEDNSSKVQKERIIDLAKRNTLPNLFEEPNLFDINKPTKVTGNDIEAGLQKTYNELTDPTAKEYLVNFAKTLDIDLTGLSVDESEIITKANNAGLLDEQSNC